MTFSSPPHPAGPGSGAVQLLCPLPAPGGGSGGGHPQAWLLVSGKRQRVAGSLARSPPWKPVFCTVT